MSLESKFYLLIADEIRAQPGMLKDLEDLGPTRRILSALGPLSPLLGPTEAPDLALNAAGLGPKLQEALGPIPVDLGKELDRWVGSFPDLATNYQALCRSALVHLLWRDCSAAERAINLAKYKMDNWALAHYVYGLLRGLQGDAGKAHFELYLAVHREPYPKARQRIDRALNLVR